VRLNTSDQRCRYLPAVGSKADGSAFAGLAKECGVELLGLLPLEKLVELGWLTPTLRIGLPESALRSWRDYPQLSMSGVTECPDDAKWALLLYSRAMSTPLFNEGSKWWLYFLDDPDDQLAQIARTYALDPEKPGGLPQAFYHEFAGREVRPWIDFFGYWQVFELADYQCSMTATIVLTGDVGEVVARSQLAWRQFADSMSQNLKRKWNGRRTVFDWLSRMRTVLGFTVMPDRTPAEIDAALHAVAISLCLTPERMRTDIRDTLLVMWREWSGVTSPRARLDPRLLGLLRQDIEHAVFCLERLTGKRVDFLDRFWYDDRQANEWACLIDALPREEELARREFPHTALMYLQSYRTALAQRVAVDADGLHRLISKNWHRSYPLRRFVLAIHRLHQELRGEALIGSEPVIRRAERIEQFNLALMHAERVLSSEHRERRTETRYPDFRKLAKETLNHLLSRWSLTKGAVSRSSQERMQELLDRHAMLHDLEPQQGLPFVFPTAVASGSETADQFAAMLINVVIARNYAAHHDALDAHLVYPTADDAGTHAGSIALTSAIGAVVATLAAR
jgi:hypothetical protein